MFFYLGVKPYTCPFPSHCYVQLDETMWKSRVQIRTYYNIQQGCSARPERSASFALVCTCLSFLP